MALNKITLMSKVCLMSAGAALWAGWSYLTPEGKIAQASAAPAPSSFEASCGSNIFAKLAKEVIPSVVNISTSSTLRPVAEETLPGLGGEEEPGIEDFFQNFGQGFGQHFQPGRRSPRKMMALGSGFIIDSSGIILTNNHVVAGADEIKIQFTENPDEEPTQGKVIARDPELDVALIQVKTNRKLTALTLGDSDRLAVGDYVMAAGNPYGQGHSVSHGIVSAKGRNLPGSPLAKYLQVDAPINPGNSGGPLLNLQGEVVGINNAIDRRAQGIGFAIPINFVKNILSQLETNGKVSRGYIGAVISSMSPEIAEKLGDSKDLHARWSRIFCRVGPPIGQDSNLRCCWEVDGKPVHLPDDLVMAITSAPIGKPLPLKIKRNGVTETLTIKPQEKPRDPHLEA